MSSSWAAKATAQAVAQIQADEDQRIWNMLESLTPHCYNPIHSGYQKPLIECDHPDCIVRSVVES